MRFVEGHTAAGLRVDTVEPGAGDPHVHSLRPVNFDNGPCTVADLHVFAEDPHVMCCPMNFGEGSHIAAELQAAAEEPDAQRHVHFCPRRLVEDRCAHGDLQADAEEPGAAERHAHPLGPVSLGVGR